MKKGVVKRIVEGAWLYGAFFGFMPAYVFAVGGIATYETFRTVYYFRLLLAIIIGALVGGFVTSFAVKYALKIIKKPNLIISLLAGLIVGAICGAIILGSTPLVFLIQSTDVSWALTVIIRAIISGLIMGGVAGMFFGAGVNYYVKKGVSLK